MITLAQLQAFSRYMDRDLLHPDIAPVVYWVEEAAKEMAKNQDWRFPNASICMFDADGAYEWAPMDKPDWYDR